MWVTRNVWLKYHEPADGEGSDLGGGAPAADAAPAAAEEPASSSTEEDVNWSGLGDEFLAEDNAVEGDEVVEEAPTPAAPTPTPAPSPAAPPAPAATPAPEPAPASAAPVPTPATPAAPPAPQATNEEYATWRSGRLSQLEQVYALDEEAANAMLTDPETVLPKLAAKVHMEVLENAMRAMQAMVPVMIQHVQYHSEVESRAKNIFASINPDLADPSLEPVILELGTVYRNVNKTAPPEVAAQAIGNLVRAALGIAQAPAPAGGAPAPTPTAVRPTPFTPVRGAGGGQASVVPNNPFEALAMEMEREDYM